MYSTGSWGDLLIAIGSDTIQYDTIGNPTMWGRQEDNVWYDGAILEWQGRQLQSFQAFSEYDGTNMDDDYAVYFKYNSDGIRTEKITDAGNHEYILNGSQIIGEWIGNRSKLIVYLYDENGTPIGMKIRTNTQAEGEFDEYFFEKNLQGDIVAVYNMDGEKIGSYTYDAWGNFTITLASTNTAAENDIVNTYNPFRYRGYYYDVETGLYYLQSRYYNPAWGRFISADAVDVLVATPAGLTDKNLFAYCDNNPVMRVDLGGDFWHIVIGAVVGALISGVVTVVSNAIEGESLTEGLGTAMLTGAASGALAASGVGVVGQIVGGAAISMTGNAAQQGIDILQGEKESFDGGSMLLDGAIAAVGGKWGGAGASHGNTKTVKALSNQLVKRIRKTGEIGKAVAYYSKNMKNGLGQPIYQQLMNSLDKSARLSVGVNIPCAVYERMK